MEEKNEKLKGDFIEKKALALVFLFYVLLAVVFTYPLVFKITTQVPLGEGDTFQALATIGSLRDTLKSHGVLEGMMFLAKTYQLNTFLPYAFLALPLGVIAAYNVMIVLSLALSGLGAYLLAHHFTKSCTAAILAGIIFAFSPFHWHQISAAHLGTMQQQWLPFFVLFLFRFFNGFKLKDFLSTAFFALLIALSEHQLLAFTAVFTAYFVFYKLATDRSFLKNKKFWAYFGASAVLFVALAFFLFAPLIKVANSGENFLDPGIKQAAQYSMKFFDPLIPPSFESWNKMLVKKIEDVLPNGSGRKSYFVGYSVLALIIGGFCFKKRLSGGKKLSGTSFWFLETLLFYLAALGPYVKISGSSVYLPYYLIYKYLPFFENIRATGRFFVFAMLGIAVLFAYAFVYASEKLKPKKTAIFGAVLGVVILLEFLVAPLETMGISYSKFYDQLAQEPGNFKILEVPGSTSYAFASFKMITNNVHKKESVDKMSIARKIDGALDFQKNTPVIRELLYTIPQEKNPYAKRPAGYYEQANKLLGENNIAYITLSKKYLSQRGLKQEEEFIEKNIKFISKYEDEYLVAYDVRAY